MSTSQPGRTDSASGTVDRSAIADIGAVAVDRQDVAVDAHRQRRDGVMTVLVQSRDRGTYRP